MDEDSWLAVSDEGIAVLDMESMSPSSFYPYDSVVTFGGCQDDFMLVVVNAGGKGAKGGGGRERRPSQRTQVSGNSAGSHTDNSYHAADTSRLLFQTSKQQVTKQVIISMWCDKFNLLFPSGSSDHALGSRLHERAVTIVQRWWQWWLPDTRRQNFLYQRI